MKQESFFYTRNGRKWPTELVTKEFLYAGELILAIISDYEAAQEIKIHLAGERNLITIEEFRKSPRLETILTEGNMHVTTANLSYSLYTKRERTKISDGISLWASGVALGAGITFTGEGELLYAGIPLLGGLGGSIYAARELLKRNINHLELKIHAKHIQNPKEFEKIKSELKSLKF